MVFHSLPVLLIAGCFPVWSLSHSLVCVQTKATLSHLRQVLQSWWAARYPRIWDGIHIHTDAPVRTCWQQRRGRERNRNCQQHHLASAQESRINKLGTSRVAETNVCLFVCLLFLSFGGRIAAAWFLLGSLSRRRDTESSARAPGAWRGCRHRRLDDAD